METRDLPLSEIVGIAQPGAIPVSTDMPISGSMALKLDKNSNVAELDGRLTGGSAVVLVEDPDAKPVLSIASLVSSAGTRALAPFSSAMSR